MVRLAVGLSCLVLGGACPLDEDPGFDEWCGERLCRWELISGEIRKAPTWHERDHGVELLGPEVVLSQVTDIDSASCLEFKVIGDIDPAASVYLEMDFLADGTTEYRQRIPSARWEPLSFLVTAPTWYEGVELVIRKESDGRVVLARLEVGDARGCTGQPIPLSNRPTNAGCETADQCAGGRCGYVRYCSQSSAACAVTEDCAGGTGPCVDWYTTTCL